MWTSAGHDEMSGAQSAHADNKSEELLPLGPADCLGASHITWFTNYAPNGILVNELYGHIAAYRTAIDALVGYFYTSGTSETVFTANTLHTAAFGDNNWDPAGAPDLTPPCLTHKHLWNYMKDCLDLLVYVRVDTGTWNDTPYTEAEQAAATWNGARGAFFAALADHASGVNKAIGRCGLGVQNDPAPPPLEWTAWAGHAVFTIDYQLSGQNVDDTFAVDLEVLVNEPAVTNAYISLTTVRLLGANHYTDLPLDFRIEGTVVNSAPLVITVPGVGGAIISTLELDDYGLAVVNVDGANNVLLCEFSGDYNADIGVVEWPAPVGLSERWLQSHTANSWRLYFKLSWA